MTATTHAGLWPPLDEKWGAGHILAQIDPLRSGGETLGDRLRTAGVPEETRLYPGVTHEFFGISAVVPEGKAAVEFASERSRQSFAAVPLAPAPTRRGRAVRAHMPQMY